MSKYAKYGMDRFEPESPRALVAARRLTFSVSGGLSLPQLLAMPRGTPLFLLESRLDYDAPWSLLDIYPSEPLANDAQASYERLSEFRDYQLRLRKIALK